MQNLNGNFYFSPNADNCIVERDQNCKARAAREREGDEIKFAFDHSPKLVSQTTPNIN